VNIYIAHYHFEEISSPLVTSVVGSSPFLLRKYVVRGIYARKQLLLSAHLSNRNSVCLSHGWISQNGAS